MSSTTWHPYEPTSPLNRSIRLRPTPQSPAGRTTSQSFTRAMRHLGSYQSDSDSTLGAQLLSHCVSATAGAQILTEERALGFERRSILP